jgi:PAS domain S-box-containing protein
MHHFLIAVVFALMIAGLLLVANIGMDVLTSMRAYVGGEGLWSKAQKDAVHYLLRYGKTHSEGDYYRYLEAIKVPMADHQARHAMEQSEVDKRKAGQAFIEGRNHPDDVSGMVNLFGRYHSQKYIAEAIQIWGEADLRLQDLQRLGAAVHQELTQASPDQAKVEELLARVDALNEQFPKLEDDFSRSLGDAARYARSVVFNVLLAVAFLALLLGLLVSYRLIVRARDADARYQHLFETASDAIFIADHETGIIVDANAKLAELTGVPVAELQGTDQRHLFGREIPAQPGSSDLNTGDLVIRHTDGSSIPVDVRNNQGRFGNRLVDYSIVRDIRERRQMEEKLQEMARMESVGRLAGGIAHDFNNLLTVILGYSQILAEGVPAGSRLAESTAQIKSAAHKASGITSQLLAFSRKQVLSPRVVNLNDIMLNLDSLLRRLIGEDIEVLTVPASDLGSVKADPGQIEQVMMNLALNARDAMPHGGKLTLETSNAQLDANYARNHQPVEPGPYVMLAVSDTGHGMTPETQARIFEPFYTTKEVGKGTGLGLSMVYGIVKQSGGHIWVYSEPDRGTTLKIYLPRVDQPPETTGAEHRPGSIKRGTETILLVEDDSQLRQLSSSVLAHCGYKMLVAATPEEGLEIFKAHHRDIRLLITDVVMPRMNGRQLAEQIMQISSDVRVLYISGYTNNAIVHYGVLDAGLWFLPKPFTLSALMAKVREVLDSPTKEFQGKRGE